MSQSSINPGSDLDAFLRDLGIKAKIEGSQSSINPGSDLDGSHLTRRIALDAESQSSINPGSDLDDVGRNKKKEFHETMSQSSINPGSDLDVCPKCGAVHKKKVAIQYQSWQ